MVLVKGSEVPAAHPQPKIPKVPPHSREIPWLGAGCEIWWNEPITFHQQIEYTCTLICQ